MKTDIFIKEYSEKLKCEKASLFIGSGISRKSGYANWKDILRECAEEINLNVDKESDLITLAEFYVKGKQRTKIDQTIASYFKDKNGEPSTTHHILSTFPVKSIWTTNYDTLIERSLTKADITYSVVTDDESYVSLDPAAKVKVHKIHGDVKTPSRCVITRRDYEKFEETHDIVLSELKGEMCTNSFLFLGYSFSDIDIQHILSKIRLIYNDDHPQRHYCIMEKIRKENCDDEDDFLYKENRQNHYINDMQSYGLNVVLVDSYDEIESILKEISIRVHLKDVLVSGAYEESNSLSRNRISPFTTTLAKKLIEENFRIITGYGKNLGSDIVAGAFLGCCNAGIQPKDFNENVVLCPFPYKLPESSDRASIYTSLRENMISKTKISIFICGEKYAKSSKSTINSPGVLEEYRISKEQGNLIIPLATTGGAAMEIWDIEQKESSPSSLLEGFQKLGSEVNPEELVNIVMSLIQEYSKKYN